MRSTFTRLRSSVYSLYLGGRAVGLEPERAPFEKVALSFELPPVPPSAEARAATLASGLSPSSTTSGFHVRRLGAEYAASLAAAYNEGLADACTKVGRSRLQAIYGINRT